jgi:hypothetical protein
MSSPLLTAFWIATHNHLGPIGFGVTARSIEDALGLILAAGYTRYLPTDASALDVTEGVRFAHITDPYVRSHMGPIVVRGLWYPFRSVGT